VPEVVHVIQLLEEAHRVVDLVNTELQRIDAVGVEMEVDLLSRQKGLVGGQGEIHISVLAIGGDHHQEEYEQKKDRLVTH